MDATENNLNGDESSYTGGKESERIPQPHEPDLDIDDLAVVSDLFVCNEHDIPGHFDKLISDLSDIQSSDFDFGEELTFQMKTTKYVNRSGRKRQQRHHAM